MPPASAFNHSGVLWTTIQRYLERGDAWIDGAEKKQRGAGSYSLCVRCNNDTGAWYGGEYVEWAKRSFELLDVFPRAGDFEVTFAGGRPARLLKQVVAMFCSINGPDLAARNPELREFVLNRPARHLPPRFQVYMALVRDGYSRACGLAGVMGPAGFTLVTEIAHVPFAFAMTVDAEAVDDLGRITKFGDFGYDEVRDVRVRLIAGEARTPYPRDYRTRAEVARDRAINESEAMRSRHE